MAKGALAAGYASQGQTGGRRGSGSTPGFADIAFRAGDIAERKKIREQDAQDKFTQARKDFEKEQQDLYGALAYEDQFDDTGITDVDAAGQKLANVLKSEFEMTQQLYRMGKIDENEVRRRNTRMKGQIGNLKSGVYDKISSFKKELDAKVQAGKDSEADHMKLRQLEAMTKNVAFGVDANGNVEIRIPGEEADPSTASKVPTGIESKVVDGKIQIGETKTTTVSNAGTGQTTGPTRIPMSKLTSMLQNEPGADLNSMTDRIRGLEKAGDIYRAGSREYTRYTQPDGEGGRKLSPDQDELMSMAIKGLSPTEKLDALKKLGGDFDAMGIKDADVLGYEDNPEKVKAIDDALKEGLNNKLMNELRAMESSKPYDDPVERAKSMRTPMTKSAQEKRRYTDSDEDRLVVANYPTDGKGINMDNVILGTGKERGDFINLEADIQSNKLPPGTKAQNVMWMGDMADAESGYVEVEFAYDAQVPAMNPDGTPQMTYDVNSGKEVPVYTKQPMRTKYRPANMSDYNSILTATGRDPIQFQDWQKILDARIKANQEKGKYNSYTVD
jgi:hypothetical protein